MVSKVLITRQKQPRLKVDYDRLVTAVSGEYRTLQDLGNEFGVTRERIRQLIKQFHLQDAPGRQKPDIDRRLTCPVCNKKVELSDQGHTLKYHPACKQQKVLSTQTCSTCKTEFKLRTKELEIRMSRRKTDWTKDVIFCSRECWGKYLAEFYGWQGAYRD